MRLVNAATLRLEEFFENIPPYAILSHTWGDDEVTFQQWNNLEWARTRAGYAKIEGGCRQALKNGISYVWVDTNCIDKSSSSELSEAINSMYGWYRESRFCYVYLADVTVPEGLEINDKTLTDVPEINKAFRCSRWFTRGWTLQELLAPASVVFYSQEWRELGTKRTAGPLISEITGISRDYLRRPERVHDASVARRMSWVSKRRTTRVEDMAYCLLGIFDINMALLYGEGHKAFLRLQEEIIKVSADQTIFCWQGEPESHEKNQMSGEDDDDAKDDRSPRRHLPKVPKDWASILAPHPAAFRDSGQYFLLSGAGSAGSIVGPYSITNYGLSISLPLLYTAMGACAILDVGVRGRRDKALQGARVMVRLHGDSGHYVRLFTDLLVMPVPQKFLQGRANIFIGCRNPDDRGLLYRRMSTPYLALDSCRGDVFLLAFTKPVKIHERPVDAVGIDFHSLDSAVEINHDVRTKRYGVVLRGRDVIDGDGESQLGPFGLLPPGTLLLLAGKKLEGSDDRIGWHIDFAGPGLRDSALLESQGLASVLDLLDERLFGSWTPSKYLKSVESWLYSERGAVVCVLELNELEPVKPQPQSKEGNWLQYLKKSPVSFTLDELGNRGYDAEKDVR